MVWVGRQGCTAAGEPGSHWARSWGQPVKGPAVGPAREELWLDRAWQGRAGMWGADPALAWLGKELTVPVRRSSGIGRDGQGCDWLMAHTKWTNRSKNVLRGSSDNFFKVFLFPILQNLLHVMWSYKKRSLFCLPLSFSRAADWESHIFLVMAVWSSQPQLLLRTSHFFSRKEVGSWNSSRVQETRGSGGRRQHFCGWRTEPLVHINRGCK